MPTNLELQAEMKKKDAEIAELKEQLKGKPVEQVQVNNVKGLSGYIIRTDAKFNGVRLGVMFRGGQGILLDNPTAEHTIQLFKHDLGYQVTRSENLTAQPETAEQMSKSFIDVLTR